MLKFFATVLILSVCPTDNTVHLDLNERQVAVVVRSLRVLREQMKEECGGDTSLPEFYVAAQLESEILKKLKEPKEVK